MSSSGWDTAAVVSDTLSAQALIGRLHSEGVPARLEADTALLGAVRQCRILVPARMLHRAKYVLWQSSFTEEELASLAIGETSGESTSG
jgi:hypothetical protein